MTVLDYVGVTLNVLSIVMTAGIVFAIYHNYSVLKVTQFWAEAKWYEKIFACCRDSATWLWAYVQWVAAGLLAGSTWLAEAVGQPEVAAIMQQYFDPKVVGSVLVVCAIFTMWTRARTLAK
jgi:hypothetical protein